MRVLILALCVLLVAPAQAHDWYPQECCHDRDCRPVIARPVPGGWEVEGWGFISETNPKVRSSQDGRFHLCASQVIEDFLFCFFKPETGV